VDGEQVEHQEVQAHQEQVVGLLVMTYIQLQKMDGGTH